MSDMELLLTPAELAADCELRTLYGDKNILNVQERDCQITLHFSKRATYPAIVQEETISLPSTRETQRWMARLEENRIKFTA